MDLDLVTEKIIGAAIAVHRAIGPGLLESAYESCLALELTRGGLPHRRQYPLPLVYGGVETGCAYRVDFLVADAVVVELKSIARFEPIHTAQALTYLRLSGCKVALLINFNVQVLRKGVKRIVLGLPERGGSADASFPRRSRRSPR